MGFLDGYRILDLTDQRGLLAGRMLADLGADVVQAEPAIGSPARQAGPFLEADDGSRSSLWWDVYAANKRGIAYDPHLLAGRDLIAALAAAADVVIESAGPDAEAILGLSRPVVMLANPGLVWCSISSFGLDGPKARYADSDLVVWAAGGPLEPNRDGDRPPLRISAPQAGLHAGADAAAGILLALMARHATGVGQHVDVSAQASLGIATLGRVLATAVHGDRPARAPRGPDLSGSGSATGRTKWQAKDGLVELHPAMGPATGRFTNNFFAWMASEGVDLGSFVDWDWATIHRRLRAGDISEADIEAARALVAPFLAARTKQEVTEAAVARKLLSVGICDASDIGTSPQLAARDFWVTVGDGPSRRTMPGRPAVVDRPAFEYRRAAPLVGEHTAEVSGQWLEGPSPQMDPAPWVGASPTTVAAPVLEGVKVLDLSWVVAGPVIGRALADFGATVIRVESSRRVETARLMPPHINGTPGPESSALYETCNAGKLGMCLDLRTDAGRDVVRDLAAWADVVVESFSPGTMTRWGLDQATLRADNPRLIVLSTSLCGQTGPWSSLAGFGNVGAALAGFQHLVGWPDRLPLGPYGPYTDYVGPRFALVALLAALDWRRTSGEGCFIDVAQIEAGLQFLAPYVAHWFADGTVAERMGNADSQLAPHGVYPCRDDRWVAIVARDDGEWARLASVMDLDLQGRWTTTGERLEAGEELDRVLSAWTVDRSADELEAKLQAQGVAAHVVASSADFCSDPQLIHRRHLVPVDHPRHGQVGVEGPRYLLSATPGAVRSHAPLFNEHTELVLRDILGYDDDRITILRAADILV